MRVSLAKSVKGNRSYLTEAPYMAACPCGMARLKSSCFPGVLPMLSQGKDMGFRSDMMKSGGAIEIGREGAGSMPGPWLTGGRTGAWACYELLR